MERMDFDRATAAPLTSIFDSARQFGLTDEEVMNTFDETLLIVGDDAPVSDYLEELSASLARRILSKQRTSR